MIYVTDTYENWVLRINPAAPLEPVVVGQIPSPHEGSLAEGLALLDLFVTEGETIYVAEHVSRKVFAFRPGDATPTEVLQCPDPLVPMSLLIQGRSLYVSMVDDMRNATTGGIYEFLLPPELQLD